jgi:hypothetical protein
MTLDIKKYTIVLIPTLFILWYLNTLIFDYFPTLLSFSKDLLLDIYLFLGILNITHFYILWRLFRKLPMYAGYIYVALSLIKMVACVLFVVVSVFKTVENPTSSVLNFMVVYFITLFIELGFIVKNMTKIK